MTTQVRTAAARTAPDSGWVAGAGLVCLAAGVLGAASGIFLAVWPGQVSEEMFSYPLTADGFAAIQIWFFVHHLALAAGLLALTRAQVMAQGRPGRVGANIAALGMTLLGVTELLAITARNSTYPGEGTARLDVLYGVSSVAIGAGMIAAGMAVRRGARWTGWRQKIVLMTGIYVFVPMMPALMGPFLLARLAITGWMLLFAALGYALWKTDER